MNFPRMQLTNLGISAITNAVYDGANADPIIFTSAKFGSGTSSGSVRDKTALTTPETTMGFTAVTVSGGVATLTFRFNNVELATGFYVRELGIFAKVGQAGAEFLFAYSNAGDDAAYIKPYAQDSNVNLVVSVSVAVGDAESVTAIISGAVGYVEQTDFDDHLSDYNNPHRVTKEQIGLSNVLNVAPSDMAIIFTEAAEATTITSGSTLSTLFGNLKKIIATFAAHMVDNSNPHGITLATIGAATASHEHSASDITSGTLPISRGGTGASSAAGARSKLGAAAASHTHTLANITDWPGVATVAETEDYLGIE